MPEFTDYHVFIWGSYGAAALGLIALILFHVIALRRSKARLNELSRNT